MDVFTNLFSVHSDILNYFPEINELAFNDIKSSDFLQIHSRRIMDIVQMVVDNIDNLDNVKDNLAILGTLRLWLDQKNIFQQMFSSGTRHHQMGVKKEYFDIMGPVFCHTVRPILVEHKLWSLPTEESWLSLFRL